MAPLCVSGSCVACTEAAGAVHVDGDGGADFPSITAAVANVEDGQHGVIVVHELDGGLVPRARAHRRRKTIALFAAPDETPIVQGTGGNPGLQVEGAGTVLYMEGLGLVVNEAFAWVDRSRIVQNTAALVCTASLSVEIRNSIAVSRGGTPPDEVACSMADITYSATEGMVEGTGNTPVGMFPGGTPELWFVDYGGGDFSPQNDGLTLFESVAQWQSGDPATDIDGDLRPTTDATPDYAGADIPQ